MTVSVSFNDFQGINDSGEPFKVVGEDKGNDEKRSA